MERLQTSNISISNSNIKYPIGKSNFEVNLPLKLFPAAVANADHMLVKFDQNCMVQTTRNFRPFDQKKKKKKKKNWAFLKPFLTKHWRHVLEDISVAEIIV